jgi:nucleoside-diphosphate-sugar epimerase
MTEVVKGDCLDEQSLDLALAGVVSAYYLVHSMSVGADFAEVDRHAAANFGRAAARAGVRRIIYLGGLADQAGSLSSHLQSRAETGSVLRASGIPVIEFRASIVVGAGSLSFQMIEALVERLPVMVCPRWVATLTQPMAVDDVVAYLAAALDLPDTGSEGVRDRWSRRRLVRGHHAGVRTAPRAAPLAAAGAVVDAAPVGLWLALVTPAQARVGRALVEGLKNPTVVRSSAHSTRSRSHRRRCAWRWRRR